MKKLNSRAQILRLDGAGVFLEVMLDGLTYNKVAINFVSYNKSGAVGSRLKQSIKIYIPVTEAWALSQKIMNGQMNRKAKQSIDAAAAANSKYPKAIYSRLGGINANRANRPDGKALSRLFTIAPGSKFPWILTAESGPGVPGPNGLLIVPDYGYGKSVAKAEQLVRVPLSQASFEELAAAFDTCKRVWDIGRFLPLMQETFDNQNNDWLREVGKTQTTSKKPTEKIPIKETTEDISEPPESPESPVPFDDDYDDVCTVDLGE